MQEIIARCGLQCNECEAYIATMNNDEAEIIRISTEWSEKYGSEVDPADVWCEGCLADSGRQSAHCRSTCNIKKCAVEKQALNCGHCQDFSCETLGQFFKMAESVPEYSDRINAAKTRLETIHTRVCG